MALETLNHIMQEPEHGNISQHRRDQETYVVWKRKIL